MSRGEAFTPLCKKLVFLAAKMKLLCDVDASKRGLWHRVSSLLLSFPFKRERHEEKLHFSRSGGDLLVVDLIDR